MAFALSVARAKEALACTAWKTASGCARTPDRPMFDFGLTQPGEHGAAIPLSPFVFAAGARALPIAAVLTALALFAVGATLSLFTGRGALFSGARMLLLGSFAAAVTFGVGKLFGVSVS